ncbi:hypothetical protein [Telmatospirillum siberiense]|uniref:Flagellar protein FliL n=1 Tax=Telmatospirillum siberiense TaxID=382514 RepID=A0A2N3PT21_9PROT|nr:hypothetical protein [Telmatospirillum siberiense]PKU23544.1 hypothetical protein CWS72_15870 [Telmatospirillum siberiense]
MFWRSVFTVAIVVLLTGTGQLHAEGKEKEAAGTGGSREIQAKLGPAYVAVPRLHVAVQVDQNREYRSLDLEVWLFQADPEKHQILNSKKKQIAAQMKEDFAAFNWEAFENSAEGPRVAKRMTAASVEKASGVTVEDVMIKTLILK